MQHRRLITTLFIAVIAAAASVHAQEPRGGRPLVEIGVDAVAAASDGDPDDVKVMGAPRVTVNFSPRTSLVVIGDAIGIRENSGEFWDEKTIVTAEIRRALVHAGRFSVGGTFGGGLGQSRSFHPGFSYIAPGRNDVIVAPPSISSERSVEGSFGLNLQQILGAGLSLHQDVRFVFGEVASEIRLQAGVSIPIGRYAPRFEPLRARSGGRPDSLVNGATWGALIGGAAMAGFFGFLANALCEGECENFGGGLAVSALYGAGPGALAGAIIDSYVE